MPRSRLRRCLVGAVLLLVGQLAVAAAPASAVTRWNGASADHPYSNPIWWPLNASGTAMACYRGNGPLCNNPLQHPMWAMNVAAPANSAIPVFAMGAGVVHVESTSWRCGQSQSRGNWLYVDHSNGVRTEYGHLGRIYVHTGDLVTAQTKLGTVGQSGYAACAKNPWVRYLWLAIRHGSAWVHFTHSYTCVGGRRANWPQELPNPKTDWNDVWAKTPLPASTRTCTPDTPATPTRTSTPAAARAGRGALRIAWAAGRATDHVTGIEVELQEYHPSIKNWLDHTNRRLGPAATVTTFTGLQTGRSFRVRVWRANTTGWSAPSGWRSGVPS